MASAINRFRWLETSMCTKSRAMKYFSTLSSNQISLHHCHHNEHRRSRPPRSRLPNLHLRPEIHGHICSQFRSFKYGQLYFSEKSDSQINFTEMDNPDLQNLDPNEKAEIFNRPKAQSTIDEEEVSKFSDLAALWWDEGGEFEALHSLNDLRIPLIRDGLVVQKRLDEYSVSKPLEGFWILDVGSGGGILSEPLGRLGASVIGLEASEENIKIAQAHLMHDPEIRDRIKYNHATVESISQEQEGKFDAVVASEVLEHVAEPETFVSSCCQLVRPGGSIFLTTLNKTNLSYALGVVAAERLLGLVSPGTHDWNKFVPPRDLQFMLEQNGFTCRLLHGMWYNPLSKRWTWTKDTSINYAIHAVRTEAPNGVENVWTDQKEA